MKGFRLVPGVIRIIYGLCKGYRVCIGVIKG